METLVVTAALIVEQDRILVTQRRAEDVQGSLWEFPGGKVEEGEEPRQALKRELREELDVDVDVNAFFEAAFHPYPERPIVLLVYRCRIRSGTLRPLGCGDLRWVSAEALQNLAMPPADEPIRQKCLEGFPRK